MNIYDGLDPSILCRKMQKARPMREEWKEKLFISRQSRHFEFDVVSSKVLFPIFTLTWRANSNVSRQGRGINGISESTELDVFVINL